jgi:predicted phage replisome organizer
MADIKKYYYLKLKDNFFDSDAMIILESMENGYLYSNILMKMYLRSIKTDGRLMFNERIPYNANLLSKIVRHNVDVVEKAIKVFKELDLIEILDNGAIYMLDIQNYIGQSSTEADRKRLYRTKVNNEKLQIGQMSSNCPDKTPPEIEIEKELEIKKENIKRKIFTKPTIEEIQNYCNERNNGINAEAFYDFYEANDWLDSNGKKVKSWKQKIITWENHQNKTKKETKPEWFDKDIKTTKASDEDIQEINKLLEEI